MEKLNLDKFKDFELKDVSMRNHIGGLAEGSSYSETCSTDGGWFSSDEQTDLYTDHCNDGNYTYIGGYTVTSPYVGFDTIEHH
jgi:hypothetical protein